MPSHRSYSTLLPVIGAVVVTAGAVLFQMARKPSADHAGSASLARSPGAERTVGAELPSAESSADDDSLIRRLRERGL